MDVLTIIRIAIRALAKNKMRAGLTMLATGGVLISDAFNKTLEGDLQRAEYLALPITLLMLLLIFF